MNDSEREVGVRSIRIEVYGVPAILLFQNSTAQSTNALEYWMTCIFYSFHHLSGCRVTFSFRCAKKSFIPLLFVSRVEERPLFLREISSRIPWLFCFRKINSIVSFSWPTDVIEHWHEDDLVSGSMFRSPKSSWNFLKNLQWWKSWENVPLEFNWFPIDSQQFFVEGDILNSSTWPSHLVIASLLSFIFSRHNTESESTRTFAFVHWITCSWDNTDLVHERDALSIVFTFRIYSECSNINFCENKLWIS